MPAEMQAIKNISQQKVFNNTKNLFCYVAHYCNLVAEFNGLVSKKGRYSTGLFLLVFIL